MAFREGGTDLVSCIFSWLNEMSSTVVHSNEIMFYLAYQMDTLTIETIIA